MNVLKIDVRTNKHFVASFYRLEWESSVLKGCSRLADLEEQRLSQPSRVLPLLRHIPRTTRVSWRPRHLRLRRPGLTRRRPRPQRAGARRRRRWKVPTPRRRRRQWPRSSRALTKKILLRVPTQRYRIQTLLQARDRHSLSSES